MDEQPVETTLYSLSAAPPEPDRRSDERHLSLLRVGSMMIGDRRELCLIKNISSGGMMIKAYCPIQTGSRISIELKHGEPVSGTALWADGDSIGVRFDVPVDVLALLTWSSDGPRPRMPRVEVDCVAWVREGAVVHRMRAVNVSQGGIRVEAVQPLTIGGDVIVSLNGLEPIAGIVRWTEDGSYGITFNRVLPLSGLVEWLRDQRERMRAA